MPLCNRKTLAPYMRTYLKQSSVHLQIISFIFMGCKRQTITLYMGNKQFNRAWKVFIATWHLLKKISSLIQILIIKTFCFAKKASVDLGCFLVISNYVEVIYISYGEWIYKFSAISICILSFSFYMLIYAYFGVRSKTLGIDFVIGINRTPKKEPIMQINLGAL